MDEKKEMIVEDTKNEKETQQSKIDQFESILDKIKKMSEALELHSEVKKSVQNNEVEDSYLRYIENALEDKFFCDARFNKINSKVLIEMLCPDLLNIENFNCELLNIEDIGSHYEEQENYIDKICTYGNKFICIFGISENNPSKAIKYESRKFTRTDMIEAIKAQYQEGEKIDLYQYDEYYVGIQPDRIKVFSERKVIALATVEETVFDKIKSKLLNLFNVNIFAKRKYLPNINLVYDTNPNRIENFEHKSKMDAKSRMKILLKSEREITRANKETIKEQNK